MSAIAGKIRWVDFKPGGKLPAQRRYVLVQLPPKLSDGLPKDEGLGPDLPAHVAVGYLKFAAGDKDCPYFVVPGIGGTPTHWCDCLGDGFYAPLWPGSYSFPNHQHK